MKRFFFLFGSAVAVSASLCAAPAHAIPQFPAEPANDASVMNARVDRDVDDAQRLPMAAAETQQEEETVDESADALRFTAREITLGGSSAVAFADLRPVIAGYENREITMSDLKRLSVELEEEYRKRGFVLIDVYVPEQTIEDGRVRLEVVEGIIGNILVQGAQFFKGDRVLSYSKVKEGEVLQYERLKKTLRALNKNPDRQVKAVFKKGEKPGTTDVILNVRDRSPFHVGFLMDNRGSRTTGSERYGLNVRHNNVLGRDDVLMAGTVFGKDFGAFYSRYLFPIAGWNGRFYGGYSLAQAAPKNQLVQFNINSLSEIFTGGYQGTLFETDKLALNYELEAEVKESYTHVGPDVFRKDQLRMLHLRPELRLQGGAPGFSTRLENEFTLGLDEFGAEVMVDPSAVRQGVEPEFFRYRATLTHHRPVTQNTRLRVQLTGQIPSDKLPPQEQFFMGGASSVRGYPEGDYLADGGVGVNVEYYMPVYWIPQRFELPMAGVPLWKQIEVYGFFDDAYGRVRGATPFEVESRNLAGAGFGILARMYQDLYAKVEVAFAVGADPLTESRRERIHFGLQAEF